MYSLDEIGLIPATKSKIKTRKDLNVFTKNGTFPIFVSPMTCIIDKNNLSIFRKNSVIPILPVHHELDWEERIELSKDFWVAFTLQEIEKFCITKNLEKRFILIDCADGHLEKVFETSKKFKEFNPNSLIMTGNIAEPEAYLECCKSGIDYIRVGIGGGSGCTTSVQSGFHASLPWLLTEIQKLKKTMDEVENFDEEDKRFYSKITKRWGANGFRTKIIADGGINTIDKAIKALALGADYVMCGKLFAQCEESCAEVKTTSNGTDWKYYYGQSSEQGQLDRFGFVKSNPEGIENWIPITETLSNFTNKFQAALKTAFSYANAECLEEFIGKVQWEPQTIHEFNSYYK